MITSVHDWVVFLKGSQALIAFPLLLGGVALLVFGWRMWKMCVVLAFALLGAGAGCAFAGSGADQVLFAAIGAVLLGAASYATASHCVALLGGLIGAGVAWEILSALGLKDAVLWIAIALVLFACSAVSHINRRHVVILVTAFLGGLLIVSGLAALVMRMPGLYDPIYSLSTTNVIVLPFILAVPTVVGCLYQCSEVRRTHTQF